MSDYESRKVRGWRGQLDDAVAKTRDRFWTAPASTVYYEGLECPGSDKLLGIPRWFNRVFGPERAIASAELKQLQKIKRRIKRSEFTNEQREAERAWFRQWRAKQTDEWRSNQTLQKRLRRAAKPDLYRAIDKRSKERTNDARNERRRMQRRENLEEFLNRERAYNAANRERSLANARARYAKHKARRAGGPNI
jgi:hypothetical protein